MGMMKVTSMKTPKRGTGFAVHDGVYLVGQPTARCAVISVRKKEWRVLPPGGQTTCKRCLKMRAVARENTYQVIVGNIGAVYSGTSQRRARRTYDRYVVDSKHGYGRAAGESVAIFCNGEVEVTYEPASVEVQP